MTTEAIAPTTVSSQDQTRELQKRIDCLSAEGGGTLELCAGRYEVGTIRLRDNVNLHLSAGCELSGIPEAELYPDTMDERGHYNSRQFFRSLILARGVRNCGISGRGTICGRGNEFPSKLSTESGPPRPKLVWFDDCENVWLEDVFLTNAGAWCAHFSRCREIKIEGIRIFNRHQLNNDGLNIDSCQKVRISNCDINSEDDALCFKACHFEPCEKITVTNCILRSRCYGLRLGLESLGNYSDIAVSNCVIQDTDRVGIGMTIQDGGSIRNISFDNIIMRNVDLPLFLRAADDDYWVYSDRQTLQPPPNRGTIENVSLSNFQVTTVPGVVGIFEGLPGNPLRDIHLNNWQVRFDGEIIPRRVYSGNYKAFGPEDEPLEEMWMTTDPSWGKRGWFFWERLQSHYEAPDLPMASGFFLTNAQRVRFNGVNLNLAAQKTDGPLIIVRNCHDIEASALHCASGEAPLLQDI